MLTNTIKYDTFEDSAPKYGFLLKGLLADSSLSWVK